MQNLRLIFLVPVLFSVSFLDAQVLTTKRTVELGGDVTFSSQKVVDSEGSTTAFTLNPYIGVFLTNNFELGFRPGLSTQTYGNSSLTTVNLFIAPAYNFSSHNTVYPYLEFLIGYNSIDLFETSAGGLGVGFDGGLKVNVAGNSLLLVKLEYLSQNYSDEGDEETVNTLSFGVGFRVFFGPKEAKK